MSFMSHLDRLKDCKQDSSLFGERTEGSLATSPANASDHREEAVERRYV